MSTTVAILESRYSRLEQIPWWNQARLRRARVLVAGAGAIGNELLKQLALLGVGRIAVADFDVVELSNLSRSVLFRSSDRGRRKTDVVTERLQELNPELHLLPLDGDLSWTLGLGLLRRLDVVLAGLDSIGARLTLNQLCWRAGVPWIDGAVDVLDGTVRVFLPPEGACFECGLTAEDYRQANVRYSCQLIPRDAPAHNSVPTTPTSAAVVAAWQVQEALKLLHGQAVEGGRGLAFFGRSYEVFRPRFRRREDCPVHQPLADVLAMPGLSALTTVGELLMELGRKRGQEVEVSLDREVVLAQSCTRCGILESVLVPLFLLTPAANRCANCQQPRVPHLGHRLPDRRIAADVRLEALGVPPLHILTARDRRGAFAFELSGDATREPFSTFLRQENDDEHP